MKVYKCEKTTTIVNLQTNKPNIIKKAICGEMIQVL